MAVIKRGFNITSSVLGLEAVLQILCLFWLSATWFFLRMKPLGASAFGAWTLTNGYGPKGTLLLLWSK
jgi:uncharacterized membrane protein